MSRDKQIEEMALKMASEVKTCHIQKECKQCAYHLTDACRLTIYAKRFAENGYRKASDVAREIFAEIEKQLARYSHIHRYAEEAHKATEEYADGSPVEMTSVWDACRLEHNGYDDYETMCQLQDNIGYIEKSRLLKEFEVDIAQLKKKYESEGADDE